MMEMKGTASCCSVSYMRYAYSKVLATVGLQPSSIGGGVISN